MKNELIILGSGSLVPDSRRFPASYLIKTPQRKILIDIGPGILRQLSKVGVHYYELTDIFITHIHPDHILDIFALIFAANYDPEMPQFQMTLHMHHKAEPFLASAIKPWGNWLLVSEDKFSWNLLSDGGESDYYLWEKVPHHESSLAYAFYINGKKILITGDTAMIEKFTPFWEKPDYLLIEAAKAKPEEESKHLTISQALSIGKEIQAKNILITHIYPHLEKLIEDYFRNQQLSNIQIVSDLQNIPL
jgi:ribonuclease BN (tRNA processing enzyme)